MGFLLFMPDLSGHICAIYQCFRVVHLSSDKLVLIACGKVVQRRILHKSYAREQSGGGGTDVRRPIRPDSEETFVQ